ncbi:efflux RND transporter permease subunit [Aporhodopirellula aestuarii]|uniref:MMPL family transporter n=1 Tax=Aporhodopirellula aestuarii TaxID=2950107 RepID=A0ABT0TX34_9BACT|nr:MMPL family transporter [Aporhodopirellula aestuarii]MCM2369154.1 MMPL family transporter [Aporhodopirellula aestuarii]
MAALTGLVLLISAPFVVRGSDLGLLSMFNAPLMWVDRDAPARREFNEFIDLFGAHDLIVVTWEGCQVDDERLSTAADAVLDVQAERDATGKQRLVNNVFSGKTLLDTLTSMPIDLSRQAAIDRLNGVLVGQDDKTSCLVVELTEYGAVQRRETIPLLKETIAQSIGFAVDDLIATGPAIDGMAIDQESSRSIQQYSIPSILISLVLCYVCLRSVWLTIPIMAVGAWAQGFLLALIYYSGETMNAILIVLPALVFVLAVSVGIHLANYFLEEVDAGAGSDAPVRAIRKAAGPCTLAGITTAIGLASLGISDVEPIRQFGFLGALGTIVCVILLFLMLPGFMVIWLKVSSGRHAPKPRHQKPNPSDTSNPSSRWLSFASVAGGISRYSFVIRTLCITGMIVSGVGLVRLRTTIDVVSLLSEDNRAVEDFHWVEKNVGPLVPIEVVIYFADDSNVDPIDRLRIVAAVQHQISQIEVLEGTMSAVTFVPSFPRLTGLGSTIRKTVFLRQIEQSRDELIDSHFLAETKRGDAWRISARVKGQAHFDYGTFLDRLQTEVDFVLSKAEDAGYHGISSSSTGVLVLVYRIQKMLLSDLFFSFLTALGLVAIVMMMALRSILAGALAMLPNIFPTLVLFGVMGWAEHAIDIGTVMTASVALGIAVDGTFHFLKWFTQSLKAGASNETAITIAYERCGGALIQTTIICACGLMIYSFSGFLPVRHFSWILLMMLVTALFGDLVLLPALLAGKLGDILGRTGLPLIVDAADTDASSELPQ